MVRAKNLLGMLMQNFFAIGLVGVLWVMVGFTLAFGGANNRGVIGNFAYIGFRHVGVGPFPLAPTIPFVLFAAYQMTFAIITPALITGATADRLKFGSYALFIGLWLLVVYAPVAHWVFAGGWLAQLGALDFAGGAVVHINAGAAALAVVLVIGKRKGWPREPMPPHSLPWTLIGTGILMFGWAGFNAGSALAANGVAAQALMNTLHRGVGGHAGLAGRGAGQGRPRHHAGRRLGRGRRPGGHHAVRRLRRHHVGRYHRVRRRRGLLPRPRASSSRFEFDDALDVIAVHLVGGLLGSMLLGLLRRHGRERPGASQGLFVGGGAPLLGDQVVAVVAVRVLVRGLLRAGQGDRRDDGPADRRGAGGRRHGPVPPRRDGLLLRRGLVLAP